MMELRSWHKISHEISYLRRKLTYRAIRKRKTRSTWNAHKSSITRSSCRCHGSRLDR